MFTLPELNYFANNKHELNETLGKALEFLRDYLSEAWLICTETNGYCYAALIFIGKAIYLYASDIDFNLFSQKEFEPILHKLILYLYDIRNELKFGEIRVNPSNPDHAKTVHEIRLFILSYTLFIANQIARYSEKFCIKFVQIQGLKGYLLFLADEDFMKKNSNVEINDLFHSKICLLDYFALNVACLRYTCENYGHIWQDLDSVNILLNYAKLKVSVQSEQGWNN